MKIFSEKDLSDLLKTGDKRGWKAVYETYSGSFFAICLRYTADQETAEDILHDSFLKIFDSAGRFTWMGEGSLKAWMTRIVINCCLEYLRKKKNFDDINDLENSELVAEEDIYDRTEEIPPEEIFKFIAELPEGYRTIFNLFAIEGKSHKEIAEMLGISELTSASQYHRARTKLMKKIQSYKGKNG